MARLVRTSMGTKTPRGWSYLHTWRWAKDFWHGGKPRSCVDLANALAYANITAILAPDTKEGRRIRDAAEDLEADVTVMLESAPSLPVGNPGKKEHGRSAREWLENPCMKRFADLGSARRDAARKAKRTDTTHYVYRISKNPRFAVLSGDHPIQHGLEKGLVSMGKADLVHVAEAVV